MTTQQDSPAAEAGTRTGADRGRWAAVWALALTVATLNTSELLPASLLTPMAADFGASEGVIGQSVTATAILAIVTSLSISTVTRRFDRRNVLLVVAAAQIVSNLMVALAPDLFVLLTGRLLLGITVGGVWGLSASLALRLVPPAGVARALSLIFGGAAVASVAAAPIGAFLGGAIGWRAVFFCAAGLSLLAAVGLLFTLPALPAPRSGSSAGLLRALRLPGLIAGMVGVLFLFGGQQLLATYLRPFVESMGDISANGIALVLLVFGVTSFIGTMLAPALLRLSVRWTLVGAAAVEVIALVLTLTLSEASIVVSVALLGVWGLGVGVVGVGWSTWLARDYPDHAEAGGGILVAIIQGSMMIGALLGGGLIDANGPTAPPTASIVILAVGAAYTVFALRSGRKAVAEPAEGGARQGDE